MTSFSSSIKHLRQYSLSKYRSIRTEIDVSAEWGLLTTSRSAAWLHTAHRRQNTAFPSRHVYLWVLFNLWATATKTLDFPQLPIRATATKPRTSHNTKFTGSLTDSSRLFTTAITTLYCRHSVLLIRIQHHGWNSRVKAVTVKEAKSNLLCFAHIITL